MKILRFIAVLAIVGLYATAVSAQIPPVDVAKTNTMKVYMHYMPWFETPATQGPGDWGLHWPMDTRNPNIMNATGKRQIASHYYPKIGPYSSRDPDVLEYHLLLMKYAGIDGLLIDWYGEQGTNGDKDDLLTNSNAMIQQTDDFGLKFGIVLEDNFAADIEDVKHNVRYMRDNYFNKDNLPNKPNNYIRIGSGTDPLLLTFGPQKMTQESDWTQILAEAGEDVAFLPLWYQSYKAGINADGEHAWVYQSPNTSNHYSHASAFYANQTDAPPNLSIAGGAAYPGFDDYYQEGGWGDNLFYIPSNGGQTMQQTLDLSLAGNNETKIDFLQLVTWNDFGEGTMIEPTIETGYNYLVRIQDYTGVPYGQEELELVYRLYMARKRYEYNAAIDAQLEQVSQLMGALQVSAAKDLLDSVAPPGDYDSDGEVGASDYLVWRAAFGSQTIEHGSGSDGNFDGKIDAADFTVWRDHLGDGGGGQASSGVIPEPSTLLLAIMAALPCRFRGLRSSCCLCRNTP